MAETRAGRLGSLLRGLVALAVVAGLVVLVLADRRDDPDLPAYRPLPAEAPVSLTIPSLGVEAPVVPIEVETLVRLAGHPNIVAVKDAKGDLGAVMATLASTDLAYYSGEDVLNLPLLAVGAVGVVSVVGHLVGPRLAELVAAVESGDLVKARAVNERLLPVYTGVFRGPGVTMVKAALRELGLPSGPVRPPLVDATPEQVDQLRTDLLAGGVAL